MATPEEVLAQADEALRNSLTADPLLHYIYVAHDLWASVTKKFKESKSLHLHYVPKGFDVINTAGQAGSWLGKHWRKLNHLTIIAHGSPGQFFLGVEVTSENVSPLGGWLYSFFEPHAGNAPRIQIIGCNAAADSTQVIGKYRYGQANDPKDRGLSHRGYNLLRQLAQKSRQQVEGPLHALSQEFFKLNMTCRRVYPDGRHELFIPAGGAKEPVN